MDDSWQGHATGGTKPHQVNVAQSPRSFVDEPGRNTLSKGFVNKTLFLGRSTTHDDDDMIVCGHGLYRGPFVWTGTFPCVKTLLRDSTAISEVENEV